MTSPIRSRLIRLAHARPDLRPHLLPILASEGDAAAGSDGYYMTSQYLRQMADQTAEMAQAVQPGKPLPDWFEAKAAQAAGTIRDLHGYLKYGGE